VSVPLPPSMNVAPPSRALRVSLPSPPNRASAPPWAVSVSFPALPSSWSPPLGAATSRSFPLPPWTTSTVPSNVSPVPAAIWAAVPLGLEPSRYAVTPAVWAE
jgi:hypothetical protein